MKEPLFLINPILVEKSNNYIYGVDRDSYLLFLQLCNLKIPVMGFVIDGEPNAKTFFHKPIYNYNKVIKQGNVRVLTTINTNTMDSIVKCDPVATINSNVKKNIVVYGTGMVGKRVAKWLEDRGYSIVCYIKTNAKDNELFNGKHVYDQKYVKKMDKDVSLVVAGRFWREISDEIEGMNEETDFYLITDESWLDICERKEIIWADGEKGAKLSAIHTLPYLDEFWSNKEIILFGGSFEVLIAYQQLLNLLGYNNVIVVSDINALRRDDNSIILLQDYKYEEDLVNKGFEEIRDYVALSNPSIVYKRKPLLDINIGFTYMPKKGIHRKAICSGITYYGNIDDNNLKIIALGNSTTEDGRTEYATWVELLYEILCKNRIKSVVYNCGLAGYTSLQEFMRFVRDGITLKADYVIQLTGVVDLLTVPGTEFDFKFPKLLHVCEEYEADENTVEYGLENKDSIYDKWLYYVRCLHEVARISGMNHRCFIQPNFISKAEKNTQHEIKLDLMEKAFYPAEVTDFVCDFRSKAKELEKEYSFMTDLSDLFDSSDVYYDASHVYEIGNKILADNIFHTIYDEIVRGQG